ncbi:ATP-binding protein [Streptomyces griseocarneus]|nr:ATP-binding protein [Streptomyces griseocarneus]
MVPEVVRQARREAAASLAEYGIGPADSAFVGSVLLVVSELVTNALRHAADQSPTADLIIAVGAGQLVIGVADQDPRLPGRSPYTVGEGLRTVRELAASYGGALGVEPAAHGCGKAVLARFILPGDTCR